VIVPERQLSLAIGKEGQNARLAAKLTGWRIDIRSDTSAGGTGATGQASTAASRLEAVARTAEPAPAGAEAIASEGPAQAR
jgi:transcription antitermination factor NusA-like protein